MTAFMKQFPSPMMRQDKVSFLKHFLRMFGRLDQRPYMAPTKLSNLVENVITRSSFNPDMTNPVERWQIIGNTCWRNITSILRIALRFTSCQKAFGNPYKDTNRSPLAFLNGVLTQTYSVIQFVWHVPITSPMGIKREYNHLETAISSSKSEIDNLCVRNGELWNTITLVSIVTNMLVQSNTPTVHFLASMLKANERIKKH